MKLTTAKRKALPAKSFAVPKGRKYPIEDEAHANNALARVSQHGTPEEKAKVRAAVHRKYPAMGRESDGRYGNDRTTRTGSMRRVRRGY